MPLRIERAWAMPSKNTFSVAPIEAFVQEEMGEGLWIDPFSCGCRIASVTNDLNPDVDADYHMDALDFLKQFDDESVDGVLYDPPYSPRQVAECYHGVRSRGDDGDHSELVLVKAQDGDGAHRQEGRARPLLRLEQLRSWQEERLRDDADTSRGAWREPQRHHLHVRAQVRPFADVARNLGGRG